jgi:hypothetical protein
VGFVKCLLAMGGGLESGGPHGLWLSRMGRREIIQDTYGEEFIFARTSRRNWYLGGDEIADRPPAQATTHVQQYKFIRLDRQAPYEPLILCLKGLQLAYNPGDYLSAEQMQQNPRLLHHYQELKEWANRPTEIGARTIRRLLDAVRHGLMIERHYKPVHSLHYIEWAVTAIDAQLKAFNQQVQKGVSQ